MKLAAVIIGLVAGAASSTIPSEIRQVEVSSAPLPLPLGEAGWFGTLEEGGPVVEVWGTDLDDIDAKVQVNYAGATIFNETVVSRSTGTDEVIRDYGRRDVVRALEKRGPLCFEKWGRVDGFRVNTGINNLRAISGGCKVRARHCIRTQCIGNEAAIALCNDNYYDLEVSCGHVADLAWSIARECVWTEMCDGGPKIPADDCKTYVAGQMFDGTHNVIIGQCSAVSSSGQPVKR